MGLLLLALSMKVVLPFFADRVGALIGLCAPAPSEGDRDPAVSGDGKSIAFIHYETGRCFWESPRDAIHVYSEGREPKRIAIFDDEARLLSWSPDGSRLAFSFGTSPEGIYIVNADGTGLRWLYPRGGSKWAPSWSPDGKRIAFRHVTDGIVTMDADGRHRRRLLRDGDLPAWSPDGSKIAYIRGDAWLGPRPEIDLFDMAEGSHRTLVSDLSLRVPERPSWSRAGKKLAFAAEAVSARGNRWEHMEIYTINVDGTGLRKLTNNHVLDRSPAWTPEGTIVFESERGGVREIYVMNNDGSGLRPLFRDRE